ncbi:MAG TPA: glycosyltransferase family 39 protein, partial [Myxococcota bacterium]|nr:glycosyltransferase family 39 protein [Myxococcota bacterium]
MGRAGAAISGLERIALGIVFAANLALRLVYVFAFRFDSDETQHLHVSWGWAHGLVQYRDLFDNHAPLFHLLSAAPLAAVREGPDVLYGTRLAMLPIAAALLALTFVLGRRLFSLRVGLWAAALAGLFPRLFLRTVEYRPDNLWAALWLLALAVAVGSVLTRRRSFAVGVLLGLALVVSIKTVVLLAALAGAAAFALALSPARWERSQLRTQAGCAAACAGGLLIAPALMLLFYAGLG